jgi:hypothetical protein
MKKFLCLFLLIVPILIFCGCNPVPQAAAQSYHITVFNDSVNDIPSTDTTLSYPIRYNMDWTMNVNAVGTITGTGGRIYIMESNDGTNWTHLCDCTTVYCDTIKTATAYRVSGVSFPGRYVGLKITKGTVSGIVKATFSMKKRD